MTPVTSALIPQHRADRDPAAAWPRRRPRASATSSTGGCGRARGSGNAYASDLRPSPPARRRRRRTGAPTQQRTRAGDQRGLPSAAGVGTPRRRRAPRPWPRGTSRSAWPSPRRRRRRERTEVELHRPPCGRARRRPRTTLGAISPAAVAHDPRRRARARRSGRVPGRRGRSLTDLELDADGAGDGARPRSRRSGSPAPAPGPAVRRSRCPQATTVEVGGCSGRASSRGDLVVGRSPATDGRGGSVVPRGLMARGRRTTAPVSKRATSDVPRPALRRSGRAGRAAGSCACRAARRERVREQQHAAGSSAGRRASSRPDQEQVRQRLDEAVGGQRAADLRRARCAAVSRSRPGARAASPGWRRSRRAQHLLDEVGRVGEVRAPRRRGHPRTSASASATERADGSSRAARR